jgi:hypothetical protein
MGPAPRLHSSRCARRRPGPSTARREASASADIAAHQDEVGAFPDGQRSDLAVESSILAGVLVAAAGSRAARGRPRASTRSPRHLRPWKYRSHRATVTAHGSDDDRHAGAMLAQDVLLSTRSALRSRLGDRAKDAIHGRAIFHVHGTTSR